MPQVSAYADVCHRRVSCLSVSVPCDLRAASLRALAGRVHLSTKPRAAQGPRLAPRSRSAENCPPHAPAQPYAAAPTSAAVRMSPQFAPPYVCLRASKAQPALPSVRLQHPSFQGMFLVQPYSCLDFSPFSRSASSFQGPPPPFCDFAFADFSFCTFPFLISLSRSASFFQGAPPPFLAVAFASTIFALFRAVQQNICILIIKLAPDFSCKKTGCKQKTAFVHADI